MPEKPREEVRTISNPKGKFTRYGLAALIPVLGGIGYDIANHGVDGAPLFGEKSEYFEYGSVLTILSLAYLYFRIVNSSNIKITEEVITYKKVPVVTETEVEDKRTIRIV